MKKIKLLLCCFVSFYAAKSQTLINWQYASSVIDFSSQYSPTNYSAAQALGEPNAYPICGDNVNAWIGATPDGQREFLVAGFTTPQLVNTIRIYQNLAPGAVDTVYLRNASNGVWNQVYVHTAAEPVPGNLCPGIDYLLLEISIPTTSYNVDAIRIAVNSPAVNYYNEIDALSIANLDPLTQTWKQYASGIIDFSSEYSSTSWSAQQATGAPNVYPACNDNPSAWASASADGQREYLVLSYAYPAKSNRLRIYQNIGIGAIDSVSLRDASNGVWHKIYIATAVPGPGLSCEKGLLEINFTKTTYPVDAVRIAINSVAVNYWNEIDAVEMSTELSANSKRSVQTGNWNDGTTWSGGTVPVSTDTVVIGSTHIVTLNTNATVDGMIMSTGSSLLMNGSNSLTIGPSGGASRQFISDGSLSISNGTLNVNGFMLFSSASTFNMSGGTIVVDGNNGTAGGSVSNGIPLMEFSSGISSFNFSGGSIQFLDPPYGASSTAIKCPYNLGLASNLKFGNGISSTASLNSNGFGGITLPPQIGNLILDAATVNSNRQLVFGNNSTILGNCTITTGRLRVGPIALNVSGNLINNDSLNVDGYLTANGNLVNNGRINSPGTLYVVGDMTNNSAFVQSGPLTVGNNLFNFSSIDVNGGQVSVQNNFTNNTGATYNNVNNYTSIAKDLVNNGTFNSSWLYFAFNFGSSSNAQTIGGTGTFNIYGFELVNNHPSGVTLLRPFTVQYLYFSAGKLFLGNNNLTLDQFTYGAPNVTNYVVINGTGKLINNNVSGSPVIFPIGSTTDYTPVTISNGSGHTFSASVKNSFTNAPPAAPVNREWNLADMTGGAVSATVQFQWNATDEDPSFTRNTCRIGHYTSSWTDISSGGAASGSNPYTRTATNVTSFSPFAVYSGGIILPVHLLSFTAKKQNTAVKISWIVDNETDMSTYEIERSSDARKFSRISSLTALNQSGQHSYESSDANPLKGSSYYRLKQVNRDGSFAYSSIVKIDFTHLYEVFIYPNPATNEINVQGLEHFKKAELINMQGRIVKQWSIAGNKPLDISSVAAGNYQLRLIANDDLQLQPLIIKH